MSPGERRPATLSLSARLLLIVALSMGVALLILVNSVLKEVDHEAEEVLDAWQFIVATDLLRDVMAMVRENRLNEAWLALETTRGLENSWLSRFSSSPALLFLGEKEGKTEEQEKDEVKAYIWLVDDTGTVVLGEAMPGYTREWNERGWHIRSLQQEGHQWRIVSLPDSGSGHRIFVAQRDDLRTYLSREIGNHLFHLQLIIIPLIMVALGLGIWRGLRPLSRLRAQLTSRRPGNLQPLSLEGVPSEVLPVVVAINDLLARLRRALESERAFTANAAHELRNPLAAVRNLGQVMSDARDPREVQRCGELLERSMARMSGLIAQLLYLARLDTETPGESAAESGVREVVEAAVSELFPVAAEKSMEIDYQSQLEASLRADFQLLVILVSNLLSNAIKYGRVGGKVSIRVREKEGSLLLEVLDDGPGVKPRQLARLFDRFYRTARARQAAEGTGLGLAIVKRIAELYAAEVWAENRSGGGLKVSVRFPPERWNRIEDADTGSAGGAQN